MGKGEHSRVKPATIAKQQVLLTAAHSPAPNLLNPNPPLSLVGGRLPERLEHQLRRPGLHLWVR